MSCEDSSEESGSDCDGGETSWKNGREQEGEASGKMKENSQAGDTSDVDSSDGEDDSDDDDEDDSDEDEEDDSDDDENDSAEENDAKQDENRLMPEVKLPKRITCDESVLSLQFHPKGNMLAAGLIDGSIALYAYSAEEPNEELLVAEVHKKSCRGVAFSEDGKSLFSISKDKSLSKLDIGSGKVEQSLVKAHESSIYSMAVIDENLVATGDDDGHLKVWDLRSEKAIMGMRENEEFISDIVVGKDKKIILTTSGDGTLSAFNVRRRRFDLQSEHVNSELLCASLMKKGQKVVCGASDGALNIFNWGEFGNISDRFPGHSSSVDKCVAVTGNVLCTGCIDGTIRAVHVLPNRFLGIIGDHGELPVESMTVSYDSAFLATCALEETIKFWGVGHLQKAVVDPRGKASKDDATKRLTGAGKQENFFADL